MLNRLTMFLVLFSSFQLSCAQASAPEIKENKVIFSNGYAINFQQKKILFDNPKDALAKQLPVSYSEEPILIDAWRRIILVREKFYFEGSVNEISIYDYTGHLVFPVLRYSGKPYFLEKENRILLAQMNAHKATDRSFLLTPDGRLVAVIKHGEIFDVGVSEDEKVIWFYANSVESGNPVTIVTAYNSDGEKIAQRKVLDAGEISVQHGGKSYEIIVKKPDYPG